MSSSEVRGGEFARSAGSWGHGSSPTSPRRRGPSDHPHFLADNLSADGYDVIEAETCADARRLLERAFPDLAIIDLGLPDGDGLELLSQVRAADRIAGRLDPDLPLLVLSGRVSELDRLRGFDRGCDDYMIKPFCTTS